MKSPTSASALLLMTITGCAYTPVAIDLSTEQPTLLGEAGGGAFHAKNLDGFACSGNYNLISQDRHLEVDIKCNDGRSGRLQVLRTGTSLTNGSGVGRLSDGTQIRVLIGDMVHYRGAQGVWEKFEASK